MDLSDDEVDDVPEFVSDYYFVDEDDEPICFSGLPCKWNSDEISSSKVKQVFLHGTTDGGLQKIYKLVTAWKFDISRMNPQISVLSKENHWIKLQKPKKSFEGIIRTVLITVNCLHILKKTPEISDKLLWDKLSKIFRLLEPKPSVNDLIDHMGLIEEASKRDQSLSKSKFIATFLEDKPEKKKFVEEDGQQSMKGFIIDDGVASDDDSDEDQLFDSVCALCDNGGRIIPCDGICMRSFHTTLEDVMEDAAADGLDETSMCSSLGYSKKEIEAKATFTCKNCMHKQHQCFSCGILGSSDKSSGTAEVFQCVSAACGYFYHPQCVAKLLHPADEAAAEEHAKNISEGVPFACPSHNCYVCKQLENHTVHDLQFAVCRRCPKSYHRKCLPRGISFEDDENIEQRAWENLLHINNRILIYCLKHKIDAELGTPKRNHLKFPGEPCHKLKPTPPVLLDKKKHGAEKKSSVPEMKNPKHISEKNSRTSMPPTKRKADGDSIRKVLVKKKIIKKKRVRPSADAENKESLGNQLWETFSNLSESGNQRKLVSEGDLGKAVKTVTEQSSGLEVELDADSKNRIEDLIKEAESSITLESVYEKYNKFLSTHAQSQKSMLELYTQGRVEDLVKAIQFASQKLDAGCDIEEVKAVCPLHSLKQTVKWKDKLKVYISPFLIGSRYTSFGRHFTKVDKLKEIVDKIHWYVEDGDTASGYKLKIFPLTKRLFYLFFILPFPSDFQVVDFCCGANDFSSLMKDKLDQAGKKCSYRNFDLFQPKNDFCFERRDWMTVKPNELPGGSKLVMGLNPPFGVNASLANMFINKALEFKPKLIVLIVPPVTERLDKKKPPYDLVWEDTNQLSGRSFYLPGSVDVNDKQIEDWNVVAPVLYLWSRKEWTNKFRKISEKHGHTSDKHSLIERKIETLSPKQSIETAPPKQSVETKVIPYKKREQTSPKESKEPTMPPKQLVETKVPIESVETKSPQKLTEASANASSDMEIDDDDEPVKEALKEDSGKEEGSHGTSGSVNAEPTIKSNNSNKKPQHNHKNTPKSRNRVRNNHRHQQHHQQHHQQQQQRYERRSPLAADLYGGPGYSDEIHHLRHPPHEYAHMREDFGQRSYNPMIHPTPIFVPDPPSFGHGPPMSTMDRYAPRLDQTNYGPRVGGMGHNGMYNYQPPPGPNYGGVPGFPPGPGPRPPSSYQRSGGWLNE